MTVVVLCSTIAQAFGRFTYSLLLPPIERELAGSYAVAGLAGAVNVLAYVFGVLVVRLLGARLGPTTSIRAGLAASAVGLAVLALAGSVPVLSMGLALTGLGAALIWLPSPGFVGSVVHPSKRGLAIGFIGSGIGAGIVVAGALTSIVRGADGATDWRSVYATEAALALVVLVLCFAVLRSPSSTPAASDPVAVSLRQVPGWRGLTSGYAAYGLAYSIYVSYLVAALEDVGFSPGHASAVFTVVGVALVLGGVVLGRLSDRWGRGRTLVLGHLVMAGAILLAITGREPLATTSAVLFGLMMSGLPSVVAAHLADFLPPRQFGAVFARCTLAFALAQTCGTPLGGFLAEVAGGFWVAFAVAAGMAGLGALLSLDVVRARIDPGVGDVRRGTGTAAPK
ncbi:MFS transporter [Blastococcus sp. BMG 814]|uniref:MFS transporter n=1 Tax=Blastococcus carthaginiensis TaxID=3050034 RepID=A0ABT9IA92_9ACTN|nr:MFS transporter [Blastococcus carthaginiensis]MDP5182492.1 MFS transporter [Blastococcus carthaginiensis]